MQIRNFKKNIDNTKPKDSEIIKKNITMVHARINSIVSNKHEWFYYFLKLVITKQVDTTLFQDKEDISEFINNNKDDVSELYKSITCSYYLKEIPEDSLVNEQLKFVTIHDTSGTLEYEVRRVLISSVMMKNKICYNPI
ncbi:MAG: hypothetical protein IPO21_21585 [Bacteroidales bacterium]|nr:hypothetical protein [Bacteroidales bacterium]